MPTAFSSEKRRVWMQRPVVYYGERIPMMRSKIYVLFLLMSLVAAPVGADEIHVLIWDERQPRQSEAYDNFLGNEIARRLDATNSEFEIRSVALDDADQGLADANLDWADVLIWWGHARHSDVTDENAKRVLHRIRAGDLDLIALHSAHWAKPFVFAMNWRSVEDARLHLEKLAEGKQLTIENSGSTERAYCSNPWQRVDTSNFRIQKESQ